MARMQITPQRDIFSVSRLVREARTALEGSFPLLWLEGEISNFSRPSSGHIYFSLKDEAAQIRCAMFRGKNMHLRFKPKSGMHVLVRARVTLYEARGDFQLVVEQMEEAGLGALQRNFEELKARLDKEGLFDSDHKKPLPTLPKKVGIITSPTGAAVRDIVSVLKRRYAAIPLLIYPVAVQGEGAGKEIAQAIELANQRQECDLLLVTRGGGSLEDLWAFNEEVVARAIHASEIPIVSGVGHEIDFTIADFVADRRAPTPSAAAELISPDRDELQHFLTRQQNRLVNRMRETLKQSRQQSAWLTKRLTQQHPGKQLQTKAQRVDELEQRLTQGMARLRHRDNSTLKHLNEVLKHHSPLNRLTQLKTRFNHLQQRMERTMQHSLDNKQSQTIAISRALNNISPLGTLERGYAIVNKLPEETPIRDATDVTIGEKIQARLASGSLRCTVDEIKTEKS